MDKLMHNNLMLRTWIDIDQAFLQHNYSIFRNLIKTDCQLMAVVKSNAYGHGLVDYSKKMQDLGVDWLGVDSFVEASKLRENDITVPILVLGYTFPEMVEKAIEFDVSLSISSFSSLEHISNLDNIKGLKIHLKFDTGMSRQGFFVEDAQKVIDYIKEKLSDVKIEGVFTHFASAKNPAFPKDTKEQLEKFEKMLEIFVDNGLSVIRHAGATSGAVIFPEAHYDLVRIGIGMYGLWPSKEVQYAFSDKLKLKPALTWKTVVAEIKIIKAGSRIGYDGTERIDVNTRVAILPVGYWHGYDRSLSSLGRVIIKCEKARILGRVSMDMIIVDINDILDVVVGDEVVLLGKSKDKQAGSKGDNDIDFTANEMANLAGTSSYEIITRLNPLIKRFYK